MKNNLPSCNINNISSYLNVVNNIPSLTEEEEFMLAQHYVEHNDLNAAHKLIMSHLKLVAKIAMKYVSYGLVFADLIQEGNMGLMHAVKKYEPALGYRLSTYAMWWIKCYIYDYILKSWSLVKLGTTSSQKKIFFGLNKIKKEINLLPSANLTDENYEYIANKLNVAKNEVIEMDRRLSLKDLSLNNELNEDNSSEGELIDTISDNQLTPEALLINDEMVQKRKKLLFDALKTLTLREADIIYERRLQNKSTKLEILSDKYNISKERVRQIEAEAFNKLQKFITTKALQ